MIEKPEQKIDTGKQQKKQGFFEIRKLKLIKLNASEIIGADIKTSESGDRIELSRKNQLGFPDEGVYIYKNGNIATALSQGTVWFYDNNSVLSAVIQQPSSGNLGIGASLSVQVIVGSTMLAVYDGGIMMTGIPTSSSGLDTGDIYSDSGTLKIVT